LLAANEAGLVEKRTGKSEPAVAMRRDAATAERFVRAERFAALVQERALKPFRRWEAYRRRMAVDPSVVAFYDFQPEADRPNVLVNATVASNHAMDGVIEGARWTEGRMPGKQALYFDGQNARVKVNLPTSLTHMTLAAWVAVESIDEKSLACGLLMSDGWERPTDRCHWEIDPQGKMWFGSMTYNCSTLEPVLPRARWGRDAWRHLAVVVNPASQQMTFFADGKRVYERGFPKEFAVAFRDAIIGNWTSDNDRRPFRGRIDELLLISRALTDREILQIYEAGRQ
jgi:hypothetical protein